jgi:putative colanic acid biosynthesis UDP-glucose lipid carrier transferase
MINMQNRIGLSKTQKAIKRVQDLVLATLLLILIAPTLFLIALAIKITSPGPVFYMTKRVGPGGQEFKVYKFRTMHVHAETEGIARWASSNDPRVTPVGAFLRRASLDELPQLLNVLGGEMSLVGPRPLSPFAYEKFREAYVDITDVKSGITGWAQINSWRGETEKLSSLENNVLYDKYYINHWSLLFDLKIIGLTTINAFINRNAY